MAVEKDKIRLTVEERREVLSRLFQFCHNYLVMSDPECYKYITEDRKLDVRTIKEFTIGSFPVEQAQLLMLSRFLGPNGFRAGILHSDAGELKSKFCYNRIIIPVYDAYGNPLAVMGRTLLSDDEQKQLGVNKYDNTVYKKSRTLFGLYQAKAAIIQSGEVCVVEGNFDVITAHRVGWKNVVAASSATLTPYQLSICARYAKKIILYFDNDFAGREATKKILLKYSKYSQVELVSGKIPEAYKDVDEYLKKESVWI